jgi:hypothetical protein
MASLLQGNINNNGTFEFCIQKKITIKILAIGK